MDDDSNKVTNLIQEGRVLCHDINQPLTVICARVDLLLMKMPPEDPHYHSLEQIRESTRNLAGLIAKLHTLLKDFNEE